MSTYRRSFLSLVFVGFIAGSLYDLVRDEEHWPFSQYPMFSGVWRSPTFTWHRLYGVRQDGTEFALDHNRYITPFDQSRLPKALGRIVSRKDGAAKVKPAVADALRRYDELRQAGRHDGPPVVAMRLYELEYRIDPAAANVDSPDRREFIAEVNK